MFLPPGGGGGRQAERAIAAKWGTPCRFLSRRGRDLVFMASGAVRGLVAFNARGALVFPRQLTSRLLTRGLVGATRGLVFAIQGDDFWPSRECGPDLR